MLWPPSTLPDPEVTGNDNTVGGGGVYPIADLKELDGLRAGFENPVSMLDGCRGRAGRAETQTSRLSGVLRTLLGRSK